MNLEAPATVVAVERCVGAAALQCWCAHVQPLLLCMLLDLVAGGKHTACVLAAAVFRALCGLRVMSSGGGLT